jgi:hypothetical protein
MFRSSIRHLLPFRVLLVSGNSSILLYRLIQSGIFLPAKTKNTGIQTLCYTGYGKEKSMKKKWQKK